MSQDIKIFNKALKKCCERALKQRHFNKLIVLKTDAIFWAAGYGVLFEDDPYHLFTSARKSYAPVAYADSCSAEKKHQLSPTALATSEVQKIFLRKSSCD